jgi:hypothetical protein
MIGFLPFLFKYLLLKIFLSKIQSDTRVWLGTAYKHVPGSGSLQRLRIIRNRSVNQTGHAGMADPNPARPSDRNVACFRQFKQAREFRIPRCGNPASRERYGGARSWRPRGAGAEWERPRPYQGNRLESAEDFRTHILGEHNPVSQPIAHGREYIVYSRPAASDQCGALTSNTSPSRARLHRNELPIPFNSLVGTDFDAPGHTDTALFERIGVS